MRNVQTFLLAPWLSSQDLVYQPRAHRTPDFLTLEAYNAKNPAAEYSVSHLERITRHLEKDALCRICVRCRLRFSCTNIPVAAFLGAGAVLHDSRSYERFLKKRRTWGCTLFRMVSSLSQTKRSLETIEELYHDDGRLRLSNFFRILRLRTILSGTSATVANMVASSPT